MASPLDPIDWQILDLLQHNAKLTNKEIAEKVGKTSTPVYERIKRLEQQGYIKQYVAILDKKKIGRTLSAFTSVQLKEHEHTVLQQFEQEIVQLPEVMECYHMTGTDDYLLKVVVRDMDEYQEFIKFKLSKIANIATVRSSFIMTEIKHETAYTNNTDPEIEGNTKRQRK